MATHLKMDKGSETRVMATMHAFLHKDHEGVDPCETVIDGPSALGLGLGLGLGEKVKRNYINRPETNKMAR